MSQNLDDIVKDISVFLASNDLPKLFDPMDYLKSVHLRLRGLADQRATREELKAAIGQGVHKGMRVVGVMDAYRAVDGLNDLDWDSVLDYAVDGLNAMEIVDWKEVDGS